MWKVETSHTVVALNRAVSVRVKSDQLLAGLSLGSRLELISSNDDLSSHDATNSGLIATTKVIPPRRKPKQCRRTGMQWVEGARVSVCESIFSGAKNNTG